MELQMDRREMLKTGLAVSFGLAGSPALAQEVKPSGAPAKAEETPEPAAVKFRKEASVKMPWRRMKGVF
jgi:hypothetical protein